MRRDLLAVNGDEPLVPREEMFVHEQGWRIRGHGQRGLVGKVVRARVPLRVIGVRQVAVLQVGLRRRFDRRRPQAN